MLLVRRTVRRAKGLFWGFCHFWTNLWKTLDYRMRMHALGVSEKYIREAFNFMVELNIENYEADGMIIVRAAGMELHLKDHRNNYEFVLFQDHNGQLVVHEWQKETRRLSFGWNEYSKHHDTHWFEVFRSNRLVASLRFIDCLKRLYGSGAPLAEIRKHTLFGVNANSYESWKGGANT